MITLVSTRLPFIYINLATFGNSAHHFISLIRINCAKEIFYSLLPTTDLIYDGLNFERPFISDLAQCKHSIVISCPKIRTNRYSQIAERLIDLVSNGIEIVVYTKEENDDTVRLKQHGIDVIRNEHLSLHAAIIDKSLIWYGSVNILGYHSGEDNLIRFKNPEIATSLLESIHKG